MGIDKISLLTNPNYQLWNDDNLAFIKKDKDEGRVIWAIYDAKGEKIAITETKEIAFFMAKQNNLELCCVS